MERTVFRDKAHGLCRIILAENDGKAVFCHLKREIGLHDDFSACLLGKGAQHRRALGLADIQHLCCAVIGTGRCSAGIEFPAVLTVFGCGERSGIVDKINGRHRVFPNFQSTLQTVFRNSHTVDNGGCLTANDLVIGIEHAVCIVAHHNTGVIQRQNTVAIVCFFIDVRQVIDLVDFG